MKPDEIRFRLLRSDHVPATNPHNLAFKFGLQDKKGEGLVRRTGPSHSTSLSL